MSQLFILPNQALNQTDSGGGGALEAVLEREESERSVREKISHRHFIAAVKFSKSPWPQNSLCWILPTWIDNIFQTDKLSFCYRGCKTWRYLIFMSFMLTLFMIFVSWYESLKEQAYCMLSMFLSMLTLWLLMFVSNWALFRVQLPTSGLGMKNYIVPYLQNRLPLR